MSGGILLPGASFPERAGTSPYSVFPLRVELPLFPRVSTQEIPNSADIRTRRTPSKVSLRAILERVEAKSLGREPVVFVTVLIEEVPLWQASSPKLHDTRRQIQVREFY